MNTLIAFVLSNFTLTLLVLGLLASGISLLLYRPSSPRAIAERFLAGYLFFAIGLSFFYNFVMHVFFAQMVAQFIGWDNSPFQYEVGYASIGFSVVAILAHRSTFHFRLAAILGPVLWGGTRNEQSCQSCGTQTLLAGSCQGDASSSSPITRF